MPTVRYTSMNRRIVAETRAGSRSFFGRDTLGSTVAIYDATGSPTDTLTYWPYGEVRTSTGSSVSPFKFCGIWGYYSDSTGRSYVRSRFYRDKLATWQSRDPIWPRERAYTYSKLAPVKYVDPTGRQGVEAGVGVHADLGSGGPSGLCLCPIWGGGNVTVDCSCVGVPIAIIPEGEGEVIQPVRCGQGYPADGFYIGSDLYKVSDGVCVTIKCGGGMVQWDFCLNFLSDCLGFEGPTPVNPGEFGGPPKELPSGDLPLPVIDPLPYVDPNLGGSPPPLPGDSPQVGPGEIGPGDNYG